MNSIRLLVALAAMLTAGLIGGAIVAGCGGGGGGHHARHPGSIFMQIDPNLDGNSGVVKANAINSADLLDSHGNVVESGIINTGTASLNLGVVNANTDYFVRINGLADDLVPVRIGNDLGVNIQYSVGQKLIHIQQQIKDIPPISDPDFDIKTFSKGQGNAPVVKYSDGTTEVPNRYLYLVMDLHAAPQAFEGRELGTGTRLVPDYMPTMANHPGAGNLSFVDWMRGPNRHGHAYTGDDTACNGAGCHGNLDSKPAQFAQITTSNGFCYRCHYGKVPTAPVDSSN